MPIGSLNRFTVPLAGSQLAATQGLLMPKTSVSLSRYVGSIWSSRYTNYRIDQTGYDCKSS
jgi:hypothetical protein